MREIPLQPYNGKLYFVKTKQDYEKSCIKLFKQKDIIGCETDGRFMGGEGKDGMWSYLVYADKPHTLAHEMAHVVFHVFDRCGINPADSGGEAFCYMLSQLILDCKLK